MTRRRTTGPLVYIGKPLPNGWRPCRSCCGAQAEPGDRYCASCRAELDRATTTNDQLSWHLDAPGDPPHHDDQLDLSDALNPTTKETT